MFNHLRPVEDTETSSDTQSKFGRGNKRIRSRVKRPCRVHTLYGKNIVFRVLFSGPSLKCYKDFQTSINVPVSVTLPPLYE